MSYLLDRKTKRKKFFSIIIFLVFLLILFYFRLSVFSGLSYVSHIIFRPVVILGNNIGESFSNMGSYFSSKKSLTQENENLKLNILESEADRSNYLSVLDENIKLKEILNRKKENQNLILSAILSKPNQSVYDTLIIDIGNNQSIQIGDLVFAFGNVPIGKVAETYNNSSKVNLFSNPGEKTDVVISIGGGVEGEGSKNIFMQIIGRGGGNFEMILPRDLVLEKGTIVHLPGITPFTVGIVETIISDPRDSYQKALLVSPVNIQELKFVEVEVK